MRLPRGLGRGIIWAPAGPVEESRCTINRAMVMVTSISLMWSEGVTDSEAEVFGRTVHETLHWLYFRRPDAFFDPPINVRQFGNWIIPAMVDRVPYWGTQWYVDSSYDRELGRVIAPVFLELVRHEPWQQMAPHLDLALLEQDLTDFPAPMVQHRPGYYSLGTSFPGQAAVMSVHRVRTLADQGAQRLALARLVRHHLGHVLAVPPFERRERLLRRGLETHCANQCAMRHAETVEQLLAMAEEEARLGWAFCPLCTAALHSVVVAELGAWS